MDMNRCRKSCRSWSGRAIPMLVRPHRTGRAGWDGVGDVLGEPKRQSGAMAMRFAPGVRDDMPAFPAFGQTILHAIAVRGGDDESVAFGGLPAIDGGDSERQGDKKRKNCRPQFGTTHVWLWVF